MRDEPLTQSAGAVRRDKDVDRGTEYGVVVLL